MTSKKGLLISFIFILLAGFYFLGPKPVKPKFSDDWLTVPQDAIELEHYIAENENKHRIKPDNEARVVWYDSSKAKTEYALLYLHGFSASQMEGDPVHRKLAKQFGCNLYLSRLSDHGIDTIEALQLYSADRAWESAKEALAIANAIGEKVIVIGTSTGGTLGIKLAATFPDKVHALINLSPNIAINNPAAFILNDPWGLHIARLVKGGKYNEYQATEEKAKYWNSKYRLEAAVELQQLLEASMTRQTFADVHQPSLTLYYYKNEEEQDPEVKVSAMLEMNEQLATPDSLKLAKAIPTAGAHVIGGALASKDVESVYMEIVNFMHTQLKIDDKMPLRENEVLQVNIDKQ